MILEMLLVISILDGDTIKVLDNQNNQLKVRLANIDAPEKKQPYGMKSKQMLSDLIGNKKVNLDCPKKDRYKRLICSITINDYDVNKHMIANGGAWVYRTYYKGEDYLIVEALANANGLGLWKTSEYKVIPPWEWRRQKH